MSSSTSPAVINKEAREICWQARDTYMQCLDDRNIPIPVAKLVEDSPCAQLRQVMYQICPQLWVNIFFIIYLFLLINSRLNIMKVSVSMNSANKSKSKPCPKKKCQLNKVRLSNKAFIEMVSSFLAGLLASSKALWGARRVRVIAKHGNKNYYKGMSHK